MTLPKLVTLVLEGGEFRKAFYPFFPPGRNAEVEIGWLSEHHAS